MMNSMLVRLFAATLALGTVAVALPSVAQAQEVIITEPPAPRVEVVPARPYADGVWMPGFWEWRGRRHEWVAGHYEHGRPGHVWVAHRWVHEGRGWRMEPGRWERR